MSGEKETVGWRVKANHHDIPSRDVWTADIGGELDADTVTTVHAEAYVFESRQLAMRVASTFGDKCNARLVKVTKRKAVSAEANLGFDMMNVIVPCAVLRDAGFKGGDRIRITRLSPVRP